MPRKAAAQKQQHPRNRRSTRGWLLFPEVKGKIVEQVEIDPGVQAIAIVFQDRTVLSFDLDSCHSVFPELSDHKSGNARPMKRWKPMQSPVKMVKW
jgi:hypothetical protein